MLARAWLLALVVVVMPVGAVAAPAEGDTFVFVYRRHVDAFACPLGDDLQQAVVHRLGRDPFRARASAGVFVHVEPSRYGYVAEIELYRDGVLDGQRVLSSTGYDCEPLTDAIVLAVSIAIDPLHGLAPPTAVPQTPPAVAHAASSERHRSAAGEDPAPRLVLSTDGAHVAPPQALVDDPTALQFELGAGGFIGLGAAPGSILGGVVEGAARSGRISFHLELRAELPGRAELGVGAFDTPATAAGSLLAASLLPCVRVVGGPFLPNGRFAWAAVCGVAQGGALVVGAEGLRDATGGVAPFLSFGVRLHLDVALFAGLSIRTFFEVLVPVTRVTLTDRVTGATLWEPPPMNVAFGLNGITHLP